MSSIGFRVETRESFADLLTQVVPKSRRVRVAEGSYLHWAGGSGEELWLQVDAAGEGLGVNPISLVNRPFRSPSRRGCVVTTRRCLTGRFTAGRIRPRAEWTGTIRSCLTVRTFRPTRI